MPAEKKCLGKKKGKKGISILPGFKSSFVNISCAFVNPGSWLVSSFLRSSRAFPIADVFTFTFISNGSSSSVSEEEEEAVGVQ